MLARVLTIWIEEYVSIISISHTCTTNDGWDDEKHLLVYRKYYYKCTSQFQCILLTYKGYRSCSTNKLLA